MDLAAVSHSKCTTAVCLMCFFFVCVLESLVDADTLLYDFKHNSKTVPASNFLFEENYWALGFRQLLILAS